MDPSLNPHHIRLGLSCYLMQKQAHLLLQWNLYITATLKIRKDGHENVIYHDRSVFFVVKRVDDNTECQITV